MSIHLLGKTPEYVILGNFTSDSLERKFGKPTQGSSGTYFITVQQILEKASIHEIKLLLKLVEEIKVLENLESGHSYQKCG